MISKHKVVVVTEGGFTYSQRLQCTVYLQWDCVLCNRCSNRCSSFTVSSHVCTLHVAIIHMITALETWNLT